MMSLGILSLLRDGHQEEKTKQQKDNSYTTSITFRFVERETRFIIPKTAKEMTTAATEKVTKKKSNNGVCCC